MDLPCGNREIKLDMKGVIFDCLSELVIEKAGKNKWEGILQDCGLGKAATFSYSQSINDNLALQLITSTCKALDLSTSQCCDMFGEYWVTKFAPRIYSDYYRGIESARDFLLKMDEIHLSATRNMIGARPPRFEYELNGDNVIIMKYKSHRQLIDLMVGLVKGVGKYFNRELEVKKLDNDRIEITFL